MIVVRDPAESLENWMKKIIQMIKSSRGSYENIWNDQRRFRSSDQELKFEHVVSYHSS